MLRKSYLLAAIAAFSSLMAAGAAHAQTYVYGFSDGISTSNSLILQLNDNSVVQAPLALNPATGGSNSFSGWYTDGGFNSTAGNDNYITGNLGNNYADFLVYDLTNVGGAILAGGGVAAAAEHIQTFTVSVPSTVLFWDINTPLGLLDSYPTGGLNNAIFADLSSGTSYATRNYGFGDNGKYVDVALDAAFIGDINNAVQGGNNAIGIGHSLVQSSSVPVPAPLAAGSVLMLAMAFGRKLARRVLA